MKPDSKALAEVLMDALGKYERGRRLRKMRQTAGSGSSVGVLYVGTRSSLFS